MTQNLPQTHVALAQPPKILAAIGLPETAVSDVLASRDHPEFAGKFVGDIAIAKGYASAQQVEAGLAAQAKMRADAAVVDMQTIVGGSRLVTPNNLVVHWGNNGQVNAPDAQMSPAKAASAAANMGELITLLSNQQPSIAPQLQSGVIAAKHLTMALLGEGKGIYPIERAGEWLKATQDALVMAAAVNTINPDIVNQYLGNRSAEIVQGVQMAQGQAQGRGGVER